MKANSSDWYKQGWSLDIKKQSWTENTKEQVDFVIEDAVQTVSEEGLCADFICDDIRNLTFCEEFDVVLNMGDGAIGYLENEEENLKVFDVIAKALKPGGKSFIDIQSGDYADAHFPQQLWDERCHRKRRYQKQ